MLVLLLAFLCLVLLILLYRYLPSHRTFYWFCFSLFLVGCIAWFANQTHTEEPVMTAERKYELQLQQKIFMDWYAAYQKDIDQLDHNWQWYHHIIENFKENNIDIQTAHVRLNQLEEDSRQLRDEIRGLAPPESLDDGCYDLLIEVLKKTSAYAEAQHRTIALTRAASDPAHLLSEDQAEQSRALQEIMIRESPAGLFTADEISHIRKYLTIPEDETKEKDT